MELKKIGILSLAKITGLLGVIYGFISGIILSIIYANLDKIPSAAQISPLISTLGYKSIIVMPILNGAIYFIAGILLAFLYNLLTGWVGGVKLEFKEEKKK